MIDAVGYIRMSTDKQDKSPDQQRHEITALAQRDGYEILRWYYDGGISGDLTEKRRDFRQMVNDATRGEFKAILAWDQDRFGRFDSIESGYWIHPLRKAGVRLVTVIQGKIDWNSFEGRILYHIHQEGKHQFLRDLSRNTARGLIANAQQVLMRPAGTVWHGPNDRGRGWQPPPACAERRAVRKTTRLARHVCTIG